MGFTAVCSSHAADVRTAHLKLLVVPGDDRGVSELAVDTESSHFPFQSVPQLLPGFKVPDEVGACVVELESSVRNNKQNLRRKYSHTGRS